jgi:hypothetical protein
VIDVLLVEERLEDAVREAQDEDVLNGLLPEVVIDAVDLPFVEDRGNRVVDRARALEIAADRLLDDDARERLIGAAAGVRLGDEPRAIEQLHRRREQRRRDRQVVDAVAGEPALVLDHVEARAERRQRRIPFERRHGKKQIRRKRLPRALVDRASRERGDAVPGKRPVGVIAHLLAADPDDGDARRQEGVDVQVVQGGEELPVREIAAAAEDDDGDRRGGHGHRLADRQALVERLLCRTDGRGLRHRASSPRDRRTGCAAPPADVRQTGCSGAIDSAYTGRR